MVQSFRIAPGIVRGEKNGNAFFDATAYPISYGDAIELAGQSIVFPDFRKGWAYNWQQWDGPGGNPTESAISVITMPGQEWGDASMVRPPTPGCEIPDVVIGTVPAGADHCVYEVNLTRTTNPSPVNSNVLPVIFEEGKWTEAPGGSLLCEQAFPYARMVQFFLAPTDNGDGTRNVMMRRIQSVINARQHWYQTGNSPSREGWIYGGPYGSAYGLPVSLRGAIGPSTDFAGIGGRFRQNGSSPAPTSDNTNYSSGFTGSIRIRPGRSGIAPTPGGADPNLPYYFQTDEDARAASASSFTFTGKLFGDAHATRKLMVSVIGDKNTAGDANITGVTIGGVAATQVVAHKRGTSGPDITAIYIANVPTGATGNVVVSFSATMSACVIKVCAGYNMQSSAPVATVAEDDQNLDRTLPTAANGWAMAVGSVQSIIYSNVLFNNQDPLIYAFGGIENIATFPTTRDIGTHAHQAVNGEILTLRLKYPGTPPPGASSWCAASFH